MGSTTTSYVYDASTSLPNSVSDGTRKYAYGLGLACETDTSGKVQAVYHADGLGSVRALTDAEVNMIQTYQTDQTRCPMLPRHPTTSRWSTRELGRRPARRR